MKSNNNIINTEARAYLYYGNYMYTKRAKWLEQRNYGL